MDSIKDSWIGTDAEVSQLPEPVRLFVRGLQEKLEAAEARADKAETAIREAREQKPVDLHHMAVSEDGILRWMTGRKVESGYCELYAMKDFGRAGNLYAAPVPAMPTPNQAQGGFEWVGYGKDLSLTQPTGMKLPDAPQTKG